MRPLSRIPRWCTGLKKKLPASAGDKGDEGSIPGLGRCLGTGHGNSVFLPGQRRLGSNSPWGDRVRRN